MDYRNDGHSKKILLEPDMFVGQTNELREAGSELGINGVDINEIKEWST